MSIQVSQSMCLNLSTNPETQGFDSQAGKSWIYPTNYPVRDYQFNIVQKALLENTLVSLPTGLGKTFIAAVVMFNFFRWYPQGKVIFMAPTRPLVKQQVDACYDITAIPREATAELTGTNVSNSRGELWKEKRVFFITPQILENDLDAFQDLGPKIKCLVFDEAHKARGNYAYCGVIRKLSSSNKYFRVLALSATPGGTINDVLEVVQNLLISHLEVRTEESLDVSPYVFHRNLTTVVVPLGEKLQSVKDEYMKVLEYYTRSLIKFKVIQGNCGNLTKGKIFMTLKNFQQNARGTSQNNYGEIMRSLNICVTIYHAYELLVRHGLRSFLTFYEEHIDKPVLRGNTSIISIVKDIREYLGPAAKLEQLPDGEYPEISKDVKFGHPKFYKLRDILVEHFTLKGNSSRVIVFFEFRDSVMEAYALLIQSKPILKPRIFLGKGQGITQRLQINVVKAFREGLCNVLLSTSIGEEGLDVGEVDLIVCFDISNKSPIRMVQRMGRTGRKKEGSIIVLVTEGKEQQTLKDCLIHKNNISVHVLGSRELAKGLKENSPRLVPEGLMPKCEKIFITVKRPQLKKTSSLKDMFRKVSSSSSSEPTFSPDLKIVQINERIPATLFLVTKECSIDQDSGVATIFSKKIEKQRSFQEIHRIKHSKDTEIFVKLLQLSDSKRFNIPMSQLGNTQGSQNKHLKQADIRNMFVKSQSENDFVVPSTQTPKTVSPGIEYNTSGSRELFNEISNFLSIDMSDLKKTCKLCVGKNDCDKNTLIRKPTATLNWIELDASVFSSVNEEDLKLFAKNANKSETVFDLEDESLDFDMINTPKESEELIGLEDLIDRSVMNGVFDKSCHFEAPKSLNNLVKQYSISITNAPVKENKQIEINAANTDEILSFFLLPSVEDLFTDENDIGSSQCTIIYSPDIFEPNPTKIATTPPKSVETPCSVKSSPILGTFHVKRRNKAHDQTVTRNLMKNFTLSIQSPSDFTMNRTKLSSTPMGVSQKIQENICENPKWGVSRDKNIAELKPAKEKAMPKIIDSSSTSMGTNLAIEDICDVSFLGLSGSESVEDMFITPAKTLSDLGKSQHLSEIIELADICDVEDFVDVSSFDNQQNNLKKSQRTVGPTTPTQVTITQMISLVNEDNVNYELKSSSQTSGHIGSSFTDNGCFVSKTIGRSNMSPESSFFTENNLKLLSSQSVSSNVPQGNPFLMKTKADLQSKNSSTVVEEEVSKGPSNSSQKENMKTTLDIDDSDMFDFSFNSKNAGKRKTKVLFAEGHSHSVSDKNEDVYSLLKNLNKSKDSSSLVENVDESIKNLALNMSLHSNPSDDEFETKPGIKPKAKVMKKKTTYLGKHLTGQHEKKMNKPRSRQRVGRLFLEDEAELSLCDSINVSDDEEDIENPDCYDASFVTDETLHVDTQMHIKYLQSVRSPVLANRFKSHRKPNHCSNIYSQEVNKDDDTYLDDSFVVHGDQEDTIQSQLELTELEILERKLEMQRKKRKKSDGIDNLDKKRRRIIVGSSDSD